MSRTRAEVLALAAVAACWLPTPGYAQTTSDAGGLQPTAAAPLHAGFQDGFFIEAADGNTRLTIGMLAQTDGRFFVDESAPDIGTFLIRKARPTFTGRVFKYFDFKVMPDFGNGTSVLQDGYFDIHFSPKFRIRSGKDKTPVGYEWMIGDAYVVFPERSFVTDLVPNRDVGVQVQGDLAGDTISYAGGVFNGVPDGTSSTTDLDINSGKDVLGRIVVTPFRSTSTSSRPIDGLGFQIGGSAGRESGSLPTFRTPSQQSFFSYGHDAAATGTRTRITPAVFYYHSQFGGYAEYVRSAQTVTLNGLETNVANHAWEVTGTYLLTGEAAGAGIVRPRRDFDPEAGGWGAIQLLARYQTLTVDRNAFAAGLAAAGSNRVAQSLGLGVNWYPNPYIKIYGTFERTTFQADAGGAGPAEHVIIFRTQLAF